MRARVVQQGDAVPEHVAAGRLHQQGALADTESRLDPDPGQAGLLLAQDHRMIRA
jgi:hypothetical protein